MTELDALVMIITVAIVPNLVWVLGHTGWTGDQKRLAIFVTAAIIGLVYAIVNGLIVVPDAWLDAIGKGLLMIAGWITGSQAVYQLIKAKLPDSEPTAKRALEDS